MTASRLRAQVEGLAERLGWRLARLSEEERRYLRPSSHAGADELPEPLAQALAADNPRLVELRTRYAALDLPVTTRSIWNERLLGQDLDLRHFRGDNPYVWQYRRVKAQAALKYYLQLRYVEERDALGLLGCLEEDGRFGCWTFDFARRGGVSRDLLDSVNEINYLNQQLGIAERENLQVIDIGAGYGRLAHRMCEALPGLGHYYCLDAIPESTYLCELYLDYRGVDRAVSVPLDELEQSVPKTGIDLAVNVHSFSECTSAAVRWWLEWLAERRVHNLLIVPNDPEKLLSTEADGSRRDFAPLLNETGYQLRTCVPRFDDEDIRHLSDVADHYFLYQLTEV